MLDNATATKLREMKLGVMASLFLQQLKDGSAPDLSFEERFGLLVDAEWNTRKNNRLTRLMRSAPRRVRRGHRVPHRPPAR